MHRFTAAPHLRVHPTACECPSAAAHLPPFSWIPACAPFSSDGWLAGWCHVSAAFPGQAHGIRTEAGGGGSILKGVGRWLDRGISRLIGGDGGALPTVSSDDEGDPSAARHHRRATATELSPVQNLPPVASRQPHSIPLPVMRSGRKLALYCHPRIASGHRGRHVHSAACLVRPPGALM